MSTLADELLQDFEDSGSEGEGDENAHLFADPDEVGASMNGNAIRQSGANDMELDGDEEAVDEDEEMEGLNGAVKEEAEDEEETKAKVEKMQLGGVNDVRSVAGLMKQLEPVLEVSNIFSFCPFLLH
jgi:U4/U6 small nuclear ribonucleoprotein PRP31